MNADLFKCGLWLNPTHTHSKFDETNRSSEKEKGLLLEPRAALNKKTNTTEPHFDNQKRTKSPEKQIITLERVIQDMSALIIQMTAFVTSH